VDEDGNRDIFVEVTEGELKETIHIFQKDKIPGSDEWTIEFYVAFFDLIGADLLQVVEESRRNGRLYAPINSTFIALIPKQYEPQSFDGFWPISLCNCLYKIIAKIIERRLKPILSNTISKEQFGFLQGRQIHEATDVSKEGIHGLKTSKSQGSILKIDLSKPFDRVNWSYIRLLTHMGFEFPFIKWIIVCLTSFSFAILINGVASPFFHSECSLRQGFPLTPLLFLLVAECLSRAINHEAHSGNFHGILIAPCHKITHLIFLDDIILFCNSRCRDVEKLDDILNMFHRATGMTINVQKSTIYFYRMEEEVEAFFKIVFPYKTLEFQEGIKYHGFHLKPNDHRKSDWR
jgi:hypothetical protein